MTKFADHFDELYATHFQQYYDTHNPVIIFPDVYAISYPNPLRVILCAIIENNPHFNIIRLEKGNDPLWDFQCKIRFKHGKMAVCIINGKTVWLDYGDKCAIGNSFSRHCVKMLRKDQIGGIIKFQYSRDHYHNFPVTIFPFFYPGFNSYRTISNYSVVDMQKFRDSFDTCYEENSFTNSIFARWAGFEQRGCYTTICADIPDASVLSSDSLSHVKYLDRMSKSRFAISIRGNGQFSHREMEAAAIGVPLFYEDRGQMMLEPFLPDYHYIKVTPKTFKAKYEYYLEHYDEALVIAKRARDYYDTHFSQAGLQNAFKKIVDMILLGEKWIEH